MKTPKYVTTEVGADGKERFYFRRPDQKKIRIRGVPWTPSFMVEYEAACDGITHRQPLAPKIKGSFRWLCDQYFASGEFRALDDGLTKPVRRNGLLKICSEPIAPGSKTLFGEVALSAWNKQAIRAIRDRYADKVGTSNNRLKSVRSIFKWAVEAGHCETNPARDVAYLASNSSGFHSWSIEEVETFEATHAVGTQERLAMGLLLFAAQRASDVMLFGPASIKDLKSIEDGKEVIKKWLVFTQQKNRNRKPIHMEIPVRPELLELIAVTPTGADTFLVNSLGRSFSHRGFSRWFGKACEAAGVPGRSHGLRKAAAARLAELGASEKEIMSITGHTTSKEIKRYTDAADKRKLATAATARHVKKPAQTRPKTGPKLSKSVLENV
jgi:integrase